MATLHNTTKEVKLLFKWGSISLVIIIFFFILLRFAILIKDAFTPPLPPQAAFGKLPQIPFPFSLKNKSLTYSLDTLTGFLPNFPDRARVYKISPPKPDLLALEKKEEKVAQIGFTEKPIPISQEIYQWVDQNSIQRRITMNIFSSEFTLSSPYLFSSTIEFFTNPDEEKQAIETAQSFLEDLSIFPNDIDNTKTRTTLYSIANNTLAPTDKAPKARIIRVDFFQKNINDLPVFYENGINSTINFLIGKEQGRLQVVETRFFYKNISETSSTYGIKTASQAFSELKEGKAYIASKPHDATNIIIRNVIPGYYIGETDQDFLMPIVIFQGENNFLAYISAVRDEWIGN